MSVTLKKVKKVKKALLTAKQKKFCREYVKLQDDQIQAVLNIYDCKNREVASGIARELLLDRRITTYIEFVRREVEINLPNAMAWMQQKAKQAVEIGIEKGQAASAAKALEILDRMRGTGRRHHSFNIAHYDTMREKLDVIYHALAEGEIGTDQFVALTQSVKNVEQEQLVEEVEKMKQQFKEEDEREKNNQ